MRPLRMPRRAAIDAEERQPSQHDVAVARAPRPIWLPQLAEHVRLVLGSGETLPARIVERSADSLAAAVIVPAATIRERELAALTLEYSNPAGRVRLTGSTTIETDADSVVVRIEEPQLIEVVQGRAHVRVRAECAITLVRGHDGEELHTTTVDLSGGGALIAAAGHYLLEDELAFELFVGRGAGSDPGGLGGVPVTGTAQVARIDARGRMGLYFSDITPADRWRLIRYTLECQENEDFRRPGIRRVDPRFLRGEAT